MRAHSRAPTCRLSRRRHLVRRHAALLQLAPAAVAALARSGSGALSIVRIPPGASLLGEGGRAVLVLGGAALFTTRTEAEAAATAAAAATLQQGAGSGGGGGSDSGGNSGGSGGGGEVGQGSGVPVGPGDLCGVQVCLAHDVAPPHSGRRADTRRQHSACAQRCTPRVPLCSAPLRSVCDRPLRPLRANAALLTAPAGVPGRSPLQQAALRNSGPRVAIAADGEACTVALVHLAPSPTQLNRTVRVRAALTLLRVPPDERSAAAVAALAEVRAVLSCAWRAVFHAMCGLLRLTMLLCHAVWRLHWRAQLLLQLLPLRWRQRCGASQ
jgi:hypothetical protein